MLRGPRGFSSEAELPRREPETGADGSGLSSFADFSMWSLQATRSVRVGNAFLVWLRTQKSGHEVVRIKYVAVRRILSRSTFPTTERGLEWVEELTLFTAEMA
jgi:hypothetical protein